MYCSISEDILGDRKIANYLQGSPLRSQRNYREKGQFYWVPLLGIHKLTLFRSTHGKQVPNWLLCKSCLSNSALNLPVTPPCLSVPVTHSPGSVSSSILFKNNKDYFCTQKCGKRFVKTSCLTSWLGLHQDIESHSSLHGYFEDLSSLLWRLFPT